MDENKLSLYWNIEMKEAITAMIELQKLAMASPPDHAAAYWAESKRIAQAIVKRCEIVSLIDCDRREKEVG